MTPTSYARGTTVRVTPCRIHADVTGIILSRHVMREIGTRNHRTIVDYWIRFADGETCLHPHRHVEVSDA